MRNFKNRKATKGLSVFVYYNLHKGLWSIKATEGEHKGKVVAHCEQVGLMDAKPKVSESGRQRVIAEQKKNVHAGITGCLLWIDGASVNTETTRQVSYNPYKKPHFVYTDDLTEYKGSDYAILKDKSVWEVL